MSTKGDKTKELICSEAYKLFAEKGFKEVTMKDICEKTGLSRGGLYRHYSSTEEIFSHIINSLMQTQENEVLNKIESLVPAKQILLELLNRYQIEMLDSSNCLTLAIYEFFSTLQRNVCKAFSDFDVVLFFYEGGGAPLREVLHPGQYKRVAIVTGSEGGFSVEEAEAAKAAGAVTVGLGPRILRCETAPLAALTSVMLLTGNLE